MIFLLLYQHYILSDKRYKIGIENETGMDKMKKIKLSTSGYSIPSVKRVLY